jgi:hypothetical protein
MADVTPERIAEIKMRRDAATPGPWEATLDDHGRDGIEVGVWAHSEYIAELITSDRATADAVFIAHARTDVDDLLAEVERLTAERDEAKAMRDRHWKTLRTVRQLSKDALDHPDDMLLLVQVLTVIDNATFLPATDGGETP